MEKNNEPKVLIEENQQVKKNEDSKRIIHLVGQPPPPIGEPPPAPIGEPPPAPIGE